MEIIKFENVDKSYSNGLKVIDDLNLTINSGEFVTLIGKSGCGKTTMLKLINGLIKPNTGKVFIKGKEIEQWDIIELRRNIGYVIQQIGLFPHMNIEKNIGYVLDIMNKPKELRKTKAKELLSLVGLGEEYLSKYPSELSGGQKQRIGVARALAADPDIILMDEPFGAVDEITRRTLQDELLALQKKLKKTIIFVTHDIEEAFKLGSKIILFNKGKIIQSGTKEDMLFNPKNDFVEDFFGVKNFTSYLTTTYVEKYITAVSAEEVAKYNEAYKMKKTPKINTNSSLMEAIKVLFDYGIDYVAVENDYNEIIGEFSLRNIKNTEI